MMGEKGSGAMNRLLAGLLAVVLLPSAALAQDEAAFRALYKELVETNTTFSVGNCTVAAEQIAARMGFRDKRTISRTNGEIYAAWGLADTATDEKIARTRAAIIVRTGRLIRWDAEGVASVLNERGDWIEWLEGTE